MPGDSSASHRDARLALDDSTLRCSGTWTATRIHEVERRLAAAEWPGETVALDLEGISALDTAGAWLLHRTAEQLRAAGKQVTVRGADPGNERLLALVAAQGTGDEPPRPAERGYLEGIGRHAVDQKNEYLDFLEFLGRLAAVAGRTLRRPARIRGAALAREIEAAGINALPIVGLLAFLMGVVIAYQGGVVLRDYGASLYIADIVGLSTVRELAPLITAIIVAGRTGSAYTAQIGTMTVTQEVDALRSIGIEPLEVLVLPKLVALVIALPLLTVFADVLGLFGGMVMASTMLDLNTTTYLARMAEALTLESYLSGVGKAPVFACIIAAVGCFRGFRVAGGADSVGRQTTVSVVQSIFLVLVIDAAFSVAFSKLGI